MLSLFMPKIQISFHHCMIVSSAVISQSFWFRNPSVVGTATPPATIGTRQTGEPVYLSCIVPVWEHASCCLVWAWKWRAYGTPSSAMQYSKRSYIIHLFPPLFWRAFLKVSLADPFNLTSLWSRSAKSWRLGFAPSRGTGWYWNDNEVVFWKEWMN